MQIAAAVQHPPSPAAQPGPGALHIHRCLIPRRPQAELADLGKQSLPTQSWGLDSEAGPEGWGWGGGPTTRYSARSERACVQKQVEGGS